MKHSSLKGVHFYGAVPDAKEFMKAHAIMIVPLLSGGGMRLKIVEGMALGKCILSTSIGAEGIAVSNGKEILLADSPKAFLNQLTYLVNNQDQIEQLGQSAARLAKENYAWEKLVRDMENFYIEQL